MQPQSNQMEEGQLAVQSTRDVKDDRDNAEGSSEVCAAILTCFSVFILLLSFPVSIWFCIKFVNEYERAIVFRFGRIQGGERGPGLFFINPLTDVIIVLDKRTVTFEVPPQEVICKDSITVSVDAVLYFHIENTVFAVVNVADVVNSTKLLCQTMLRNLLGTKTLAEMMASRDSISQTLQVQLDRTTGAWGVKVERIEVKDIRLPQQLQRAMASEAEASREARAKVIAAEGEYRASTSLKVAADIMAASTGAIQLRYMQTLNTIASEKKSTIVFPLPMNLLLDLSQTVRHRNS